MNKNKISEKGTHSFEVADVKKYGSIEKALIMKEIKGMAIYKLRNRQDGWVYYSRNALAQKFPYLKTGSIKRWIQELEKDGFLKSRIKNKYKYDKTKSYFPTEIESEWVKITPSIGQNDQPIGQNDQTIPSQSFSHSFNNINNIAKQASPNDVVNYFFKLKGWANKDKSFYENNKIVYKRFIRPAKELLNLCDGNLEEAKYCLKKVADWAISHNLDWGIETVFKKWYEIDELKPKEKVPYIDGLRAFQRVEGGKWYVISKDGQIREYGATPQKIEYK